MKFLLVSLDVLKEQRQTYGRRIDISIVFICCKIIVIFTFYVKLLVHILILWYNKICISILEFFLIFNIIK